MTDKDKLQKFYKLVVVEDEQEDFVYLNNKIKRCDLDFLKSPNKESFTSEDMINFAQIIISQYKFGNTNIEKIELLIETLNLFKI